MKTKRTKSNKCGENQNGVVVKSRPRGELHSILEKMTLSIFN